MGHPSIVGFLPGCAVNLRDNVLCGSTAQRCSSVGLGFGFLNQVLQWNLEGYGIRSDC